MTTSDWNVGSIFENRIALSNLGVHKQTRAGISGQAATGAESIVLSGGYEDDDDRGDEIIYTGEGGRDSSTGQQIADQKLERGNLAMRVSYMLGKPVRVIRRVAVGYRFDGYFRIEDSWVDRGRSGFQIYRFRLKKISLDILPALADAVSDKIPPAVRKETMVQRIVRDTQESLAVKKLYDYTCQVCQKQLRPKSTPYAEGAHIKPLGRPHNGPDIRQNLLCLCPNDHVLFDYGGFSVAEDFKLMGTKGQLAIHPKHQIDPSFLQYHREHYYGIGSEQT